MNHCVPDWDVEDDPTSTSFRDLLPTVSKKTTTRPDQEELMELLWRNGHVVVQSQSQPRSPPADDNLKLAPTPESTSKNGVAYVNYCNLIQEDETTSWFQHPVDDSLEGDFCSVLFSEILDVPNGDKPNKDHTVMLESVSNRSILEGDGNLMPPPKLHGVESNQMASSSGNGGIINFEHFIRPLKGGAPSLNGSVGVIESGEASSIRMRGSSFYRSNMHVHHQADLHFISCNNAEDSCAEHKEIHAKTSEGAIASSSCVSAISVGKMDQQSGSNKNHKRKSRDGDENECTLKDTEHEFVEGNKTCQRSASARRSRAAEVHNLSERRRRDRINEKMKALQELIPHCTKSDKASMLEEAIEYLKSLQTQVQLMWMGSGMRSMMFPGIQHYMPHMPPFHPSASLSLPNSHCQMQHMPPQYLHYLSFQPMQPPPQAMNANPFGSHVVHQNKTATGTNAAGPSKSIENSTSD